MELLSEELNLRLSQMTDSLMNFLQVQITRAINSAINDKMVPEIQNIMGTLSLGQRDTESGSSPNNQDNTEGTNGFISKITKKDSRSACNLRDTDDRSPHINAMANVGLGFSPISATCSNHHIIVSGEGGTQGI